MSTIALALIPRAVALNLAIGAIVAALKLPVYLDSIGTVLVAALAGPVAGILTGVTSNLVLGMLSSPTFIAFIPVTAVIGATAGLASRVGAFRSVPRALATGVFIGLLAGAASVPIVLALFGGVTAGGTGIITIALRALDLPLESAALISSISVDVVDKNAVVRDRRCCPGTASAPDWGPLRLAAPRHVIARLRGINPLTALAAAVLLVVVTYVVPAPAGPLAALALALTLAAMTGAARRVVILAAAIAIPTWIFLAVMDAIVAPAGDTVRIGGVAVASGALLPAAWVSLRLGAAVAALGWVVMTTPPQRLVRALAQRGLPAWLQYVLAASLAAVPEARRRAGEVLDSQRCRGLAVGGGPLSRLRAMLPLVGPLMVSLVTDAERSAIALDARAFHARGERTSLTDVADPNEERTLRIAIWTLTIVLIVWGAAR